MKKALLSVLVLALLFSFVGTAMAQRPPRAICWQWDAFSDRSVITTKPGGKVVLFDGREKFYAITGQHFIPGTLSVPVTGNGHMAGEEFRFSFHGSYWDGAFMWVLEANGFWDVVLGTGSITYEWSNGASGTVGLVAVPCLEELIPFGQTSTGQ